LKEAMGPCGITFENRDQQSLAAALKRLLLDPALEESLHAAAPSHLARFHKGEVARAYLQLIDKSGR
jgi:glycosyltransferase involved in cell wall biosynthesis